MFFVDDTLKDCWQWSLLSHSLHFYLRNAMCLQWNTGEDIFLFLLPVWQLTLKVRLLLWLHYTSSGLTWDPGGCVKGTKGKEQRSLSLDCSVSAAQIQVCLTSLDVPVTCFLPEASEAPLPTHFWGGLHPPSSSQPTRRVAGSALLGAIGLLREEPDSRSAGEAQHEPEPSCCARR